MIYRIDIHFNTPLALSSNGMMLDGLLAWLKFKDEGCEEMTSGVMSAPLEVDLPILKHRDGYNLCSRLMYDRFMQETTTYKRQFDTKHIHWTKSDAQIDTTKGTYKDCRIPLNIISAPKAWFFVHSNNIDAIELMLYQLPHISHESNQGYGEVDHFVIRKLDHDPFKKRVMRPIPARLFDKLTEQVAKFRIKHVTWMYPYWNTARSELCVVDGEYL